MEFSKEIQEFLNEKFPGVDIESMSLKQLKQFREDVLDIRNEYALLELSQKTLGNAAYGASANHGFYFYNVKLAGDITGECRHLTKTMNENLIEWFHEGIWKRKDLWKQFDFELDESKHDWYRKQDVWIYSDTDSSYVTYGTFFKAMTPEYQKKYASDDAKVQWILKYNQEFQDKLNNQWCEELYGPRHGKNIHNFELETISRAGIYLKKKKYLKGLVFNKGKFLKEPKISGTGIEIIKSTTPKMCRDILKDLMKSLMFDFDESSSESRNKFIEEFSEKLAEYRRQFIKAPYEEISQSVGIGDYNKFVEDDTNFLILGKGCPVSVHAIARYNYMAHKNGEDNKRIYTGKIKYYNIAISKGKDKTGYFGFPAGELPEWAPEMDKLTQWQKNVIDPINRFLEVMKIPLVNASNVVQLDLFGGNDDLFN